MGTATRSSDYSSSVEDQAESLLSYVAEITAKHNIMEEVQETGYYKDVSPFIEDTSDSGFLSALNGNGSDEFFRIITELFAQGGVNYSLDGIIANNRLLPNEQIALTVTSAFLQEEGLTRIAHIMACREKTAKKMVLAMVVGCFGGPAAMAIALGIMIDAFADEIDCMG